MDREAGQRSALRRNRAIATGLLLAMAVIFIATAMISEPGFWVALLHATAEAGVVGGLADWFAVTALFRRPLGLPIPHTAIIPQSKDRIGEGLGAFLERHFLTEEVLLAKLRALDPARRLAAWLAAPGHADMIAERIARLLPHLVRALDDEEIRAFTARALGEQLREVDIAPMLGKAMGLLTAGGYHAAMLDRGLELGADFLDRNAEGLELAAANTERRRWWIPKAVDQQIARAILRGVGKLLHDLQQPDNATRGRLLHAIDERARDLATSPEQRAKIEAVKKQVLEHPDVQAWLASVWDRVRDVTLADLEHPSSKTHQVIATAIASVGRALLADEGMRERLNGAVETAVTALLPWRGELTRFITDVIRRWDQRVLTERMELVLGADLQYIRMTGTVVGGSVGCLLFLLSQMLR